MREATAGSVFVGLLIRDGMGMWRRRGELISPLLFALMVATLFPLALGPEAAKLSRVASGVCWVIVLLASQLSLEAMFRSDVEDGSLDAMLVSGQSLTLMMSAKILLHWLTTGLPLLLMAPVIALSLGMPKAGLTTLILTLLLGTPQLSVIGACAAGLTASLRRSGILLALIVLPLAVPVLIFGAGAVELVLTGGQATQPLLLLAAGAVLSLAFGPLVCAASVRMSAS
ncbi:MAG: heme exporter protein CcmB [Pseudomonadota bacterium]|nr:heme exporter protein CcmB [Pseudomonadota bacterium]